MVKLPAPSSAACILDLPDRFYAFHGSERMPSCVDKTGGTGAGFAGVWALSLCLGAWFTRRGMLRNPKAQKPSGRNCLTERFGHWPGSSLAQGWHL